MSILEIEAIYRQYPFLNNFLKRQYVLEAKVKEWDEEFLSRTLADFCHDNIYLVDSSGGKLTSVRGTFRKENVGQAMNRLGTKICQIRYAVRCYLNGGDAITLYKVPQGYSSVQDWLNAQIKSL